MKKVIERILNLLAFLLTAGRPVTAEEIRYTVKGYNQTSDEAFRRTFERDKDLLRSLGVPITLRHTDIWEVESGYVVPSDDYAIEDPGLTDEERSALLLAAQAVRFGGQATEAAAIFKLGGAPASSGGALAADLGRDLRLLGRLFEAVSDQQRVRFTYRDRARVVEPYALGHRFGHWYLLAPEAGASETIKAFRVDRMGRVTTDERKGSFSRPSTFDPANALSGLNQPSVADAPTATVRFTSDVADVAEGQATRAVELSRTDEHVTFEIPVMSETAFIGWIIGFDDKARIESPPSLVESFLASIGSA